MKSLLLAGAAALFAAGAYLPPVMAQTTPYTRGYASEATPQAVEAGDPAAGTAAAGLNAPHYAYRYHYAGSPRHPRWEAGPVLVR